MAVVRLQADVQVPDHGQELVDLIIAHGVIKVVSNEEVLDA